MKLIAIDSSGLVATIAIIEEDNLLAEYTVNYKRTHSQTLMPMLDELVKRIELDLSDVDAIVISEGPGSFTGLRIGSATAKGLGQALEIPIISVPTLDALAYNFYGSDKVICPMMDARRNQVYTGIYEFEDERLELIIGNKAIDIMEIISEINGISREVIFLGDGVPVYKEIIKENIRVKYSFAPPHRSRQSAASLGTLGLEYYKMGKTQEPKEHKPVYLRISQAERELAEKESTRDN